MGVLGVGADLQPRSLRQKVPGRRSLLQEAPYLKLLITMLEGRKNKRPIASGGGQGGGQRGRW